MTSKDIGYQALHLLLLAVVVLMSTSCDNGRKQRLRMEIEKANRDLPAEVEGLGRLDSMALEEDAQFVAYYYTVLRENVTACTWDIERLVIYATGKYGERYLGDEYRFSIRFQCKDADIGSSFKITLDQFQIKLIMDRYFPKISSDENPAYNVTKAYAHRISSIKKYASAPVI